MQTVQSTGRAISITDQYLPLLKDGELQEQYWTYTYGPVYDTAGRVVGVFDVTQNTTVWQN